MQLAAANYQIFHKLCMLEWEIPDSLIWSKSKTLGDLCNELQKLDSSVHKVLGYGWDFSLCYCIQTNSGIYSAYYPMGVLSLDIKCA